MPKELKAKPNHPSLAMLANGVRPDAKEAFPAIHLPTIQACGSILRRLLRAGVAKKPHLPSMAASHMHRTVITRAGES